MVSGDRIAGWLSRLVQIPSVNPAQAGPRSGVAGEAALAHWVAERLRELGAAVERHEVEAGRPNVYALLPGRSARLAAVDVHLDTVGVEQMTGDPFSGEKRDGRVYGRGAVDTKATLAVVLALLEAAHQRGTGPGPSLLIAATMDEEVEGLGAQALARWVRGRELVVHQLAVAEPTLCTPVFGHKGVVRLEYHIRGKAAHSSQPHLGRNAIVAAAPLVEALHEEDQRLARLPPHPDLGQATLTVTRIHGGTGANVVPDECRVVIDRRVLPGERSREVVEALTALAYSISPEPLEVTQLKVTDAFSQDPASPWIQQLARWSGREPLAAPYGTNAFAYVGLARECVVMGPGSISQAHGAEEWVEIAELERLADIYARWWELDV